MTDFITEGIDNIDLNVDENEPDPLSIKPELKRCYNREEAYEQGLPELPEGAEGNNTSWVKMEEQDIMNMFVDLVHFKDGTDKIDWEKIDYDIYGEDWYRTKYPHFPEEWYALLVKASREKFADLTKETENKMKIKQGNFTVSFED